MENIGVEVEDRKEYVYHVCFSTYVFKSFIKDL